MFKINTLYGDSIFANINKEDDFVNSSSIEDYEKFDRIFGECLDIMIDDYSLSIDEGANIDIWKSFNSHKKSYRTALSKAHFHMRTKEWSESIQYLTTAKKEIDECKKEVNKTTSDVGSVAFGFLLNSVLSMVMDTIPGMSYLIAVDRESAIGSEIRKAVALPAVATKATKKINKVSKALIKNDIKMVTKVVDAKAKCDNLIKVSKGAKVISYTTQVLYAISRVIDDIYGIIKAFKADEKNERLTVDKLNVYKNNIIHTLDKFTDTVEKELKAVKEKSREEARKS